MIGAAHVLAAGVAIVILIFWRPLGPSLFGRPLSGAEIFGIAPDPTVIATLGFLLAARGRLLPLLLPNPLIWSLLSGLTPWAMDDPQAWLPLLSVAMTLVIMFFHTTVTRSASRRAHVWNPDQL